MALHSYYYWQGTYRAKGRAFCVTFRRDGGVTSISNLIAYFSGKGPSRELHWHFEFVCPDDEDLSLPAHEILKPRLKEPVEWRGPVGWFGDDANEMACFKDLMSVLVYYLDRGEMQIDWQTKRLIMDQGHYLSIQNVHMFNNYVIVSPVKIDKYGRNK